MSLFYCDFLDVLEKFYEDLYKNRDLTENGPIETRNEADIPEITFGEVKDAIRRMKKGKAHGVDMVSAELIKSESLKMVNLITNMFNSIIKQGKRQIK